MHGGNNKIKMMALCLVLSLAGTIIFFYPAPGFADESGGWSYSFTPYIFALGMKADVATLPPAPSAEVDVSFGDILDNLDIAFMGVGEARKGKFGIWGDLFFFQSFSECRHTGSFLFRGGL